MSAATGRLLIGCTPAADLYYDPTTRRLVAIRYRSARVEPLAPALDIDHARDTARRLNPMTHFFNTEEN